MQYRDGRIATESRRGREKRVRLFVFVLLALGSGANCIAQRAEFAPDYGDSQRKVFRADGLEMSYVDIGSGSAIVLIHGALGDYRSWQSLMEAGKDRFRLIAPSLRGAYPNPSSAGLPGSDWEDVTRLIESLGIRPVALVGHSLGGAIAAKIALERPDLVRALVLEEPALIPPPPPGENIRPSGMQPFIELMLAGEVESGVMGFIDFVSGPGAHEAFGQAERHALVDNYRTLTEGVGPPAVSCDDAARLSVPVLYVKGEVSPFAENPIEQCIPNRTVTTIANASHGIHYENPTDFNQETLAFLESR